jgi:hypothetical protein
MVADTGALHTGHEADGRSNVCEWAAEETVATTAGSVSGGGTTKSSMGVGAGARAGPGIGGAVGAMHTAMGRHIHRCKHVQQNKWPHSVTTGSDGVSKHMKQSQRPETGELESADGG